MLLQALLSHLPSASHWSDTGDMTFPRNCTQFHLQALGKNSEQFKKPLIQIRLKPTIAKLLHLSNWCVLWFQPIKMRHKEMSMQFPHLSTAPPAKTSWLRQAKDIYHGKMDCQNRLNFSSCCVCALLTENLLGIFCIIALDDCWHKPSPKSFPSLA